MVADIFTRGSALRLKKRLALECVPAGEISDPYRDPQAAPESTGETHPRIPQTSVEGI